MMMVVTDGDDGRVDLGVALRQIRLTNLGGGGRRAVSLYYTSAKTMIL